jgi:hypothetical protein
VLVLKAEVSFFVCDFGHNVIQGGLMSTVVLTRHDVTKFSLLPCASRDFPIHTYRETLAEQKENGKIFNGDDTTNDSCGKEG